MNAVFADASFYIAIVNERDEFYTRAHDVASQLDGHVVTTEFVLTEVANFCVKGNQRQVFADLVSNLRGAEDVEIVHASAELFDRGLALFIARPDKDWSLTDCISMLVMEDRGLTRALSTDHHFEQANFEILLR